MNFSRAKTILIFIFIFVDLFLLFIYNLFVLNEKTIDKDTLIKVLNNNNITIDESLIKEYKNTLEGVNVTNLAGKENEIVTSFLGKEYKEDKDKLFKTEDASLTIVDSTIEFNISNPKDKKYKDINELNAGNKIINTLGKYDFDKSSLNVYNVSKNSNGEFCVTISYKYEDIPVFNHTLYAFANEKGLESLKGSVISLNRIKKQVYDIIEISDILLEFINNPDLKSGNENPQIVDIKLGYYLPGNELEASTYAIPSYEIKLKSGKIYYYDARVDIDSSFKLLGSKIEF